jgi:hypothetical protein
VSSAFVRALVTAALLAGCTSLPAPTVTPPGTLRVSETTQPPSTPHGDPTARPSPTIDLTDRDTYVALSGFIPDQTYLLAGNYMLTAEGKAAPGNDYCSIIAWAVPASFRGDGHTSDSIQLAGFTGTSGGSYLQEGPRTFPRGTYRVVVTGTPSESGATGDKLCPEWQITLEAR